MSRIYKSFTISFKPDSNHLYKFLSNKGNKSAYILQLIERDMNKEDNASLKQTIKTILFEVLNENEITLIEFKKNSIEKTLTDYDISIINDYF